MYKEIFNKVLKVEVDKIDTSTLIYRQYPKWDSLAHLTIIQSIEDEYNIMFTIEEMTEFTSYENGLSIIQKKIGMDVF